MHSYTPTFSKFTPNTYINQQLIILDNFSLYLVSKIVGKIQLNYVSYIS
jgi:hypothetical protein